jgi:hypothetical protein
MAKKKKPKPTTSAAAKPGLALSRQRAPVTARSPLRTSQLQ